MSSEFLEHRFLKKNSLEHRDYQVNLANQAKSENCLVVLPTGLGKTAVAIQVIADYLEKGTGGVLFLAPTRVLANQHFEFLKNNLQTGVPKGLQNDFKHGFRVSTGDKNLSKSIKEVANELISTDGTVFYFN